VYLNALKALDQVEKDSEGDEKTGARMLRRAMEEPIRQLAANAGLDGSVIIDGVRRAQAEKKSPNQGYDIITNKYVDMFEAGIIDPVKVARSALENAGSIAAMILTTEALITDIPEKEKMPSMPPGGGMDY
jgi:chaperonin GroEL